MKSLKPISKFKIWSFILALSVVFLVSFLSFAYAFYNSGTVLWESLLAAGLYAAALGLFTAICLLGKPVIAIFIIGTLGLTLLVSYFGSGNPPAANCPVATFCFDTNSAFLTQLISTGFWMVTLVDSIFATIFGVILLWALIKKWPRVLYFTGSLIHLLFALLLFAVQKGHLAGVPPYTTFQWTLWGLFVLIGLGSLGLGLFYKRFNPDRFKKIYGIVVLGSIPFLILLVPFSNAG